MSDKNKAFLEKLQNYYEAKNEIRGYIFHRGERYVCGNCLAVFDENLAYITPFLGVEEEDCNAGVVKYCPNCGHKVEFVEK